ncbi:AsmA-like C-terminal region-containing protein [Oceanicella actignis]|uniref:AsmA-like C-terminal region-containing protein n=1 Tax=Oceanicella actignis TaxID=1189325 RepID=UPI0011E75BA3|nr:AsmA-like C-terminal region-containing protein [Oceanicella actignis]TYO88496.1 AsmA-like protein [Oceanicella actignis]
MHPHHRKRMARARRAGPPRRSAARAALARLVGLAVSLTMLAALVGAAGYLRLRQGPAPLDALLAPAIEALNQSSNALFEADGAEFALGAAEGMGGLRLRGVRMRDADGRVVARLPALTMRVRLPDLVMGRLRPTAILAEGLDLRLERGRDGRLDIALGAAEEDAAGDQLLDLLLPDAEGPTGALRVIEGRGLRLRYVDRAAGANLTARNARLTLRRVAGGVSAALAAELPLPGGAPARLTATARRMDADGLVEARLRLTGVRLDALSARAPALAGLGLEGSAAIEARARLAPGLRLVSLEGAARLERQGAPLSAPVPALSEALARFAYDASSDRVTLREASLSGDVGALKLAGRADLTRDPEGRIAGARLALRLLERGALGAGLGFAAPRPLEGAEFRGALDLSDPSAGWALRDGRFALTLAGARIEGRVEGRLVEAGLAGALHATLGPMPVAALAPNWPLGAAPGARAWVARSLSGGRVDGAQLFARRGPDDVEAALDFAFSGVSARVLDGMPPIREGAGRGRLAGGRFEIGIDRGWTAPPGGGRIDLAGSSFAIEDLSRSPEIGRPDIRARGAVADMLALIDQPPLGLVRRLGADLGPVRGVADVRARLRVPLLADLSIERVGVQVEAALRGLALRDPALGLQVRAETATLKADDDGLSLSGDAMIEGAPVRLRWDESFSPPDGGAGTRLRASAAVDGALLRRLGVEAVRIEAGAAAVSLDARIGRGGEARLDARLEEAALSIPALGWSKPAGAPGTLSAEAAIAPGGAARITALRLRAPGLEAEGRGQVSAGGALTRLRLSRLKIDGAADLAVELSQDDARARTLRLSGALLDLRRLKAMSEGAAPRDAGSSGASGGASEGVPTRVSLALERLILAEGAALHEARGSAEIAPGRVLAEVSGRVNGGPEATARWSDDGQGGRLRVRAEDAGATLRALDLFPSGEGGALTLTARPAAQGGAQGADLTGRLVVRGMRVKSDTALTRLLRSASLFGVIEDMGGGGLLFTTIDAPFRLHGDVIEIENARAQGPSLGLTLGGVYNLRDGRIAMDGVLTPAYAVNGALAQLPVLGALFGGKGEGLIGVTFAIAGPREDPEVSVNPLSALAPGVLRKLIAPRRGVPEDVASPDEGGLARSGPDAGPAQPEGANAAAAGPGADAQSSAPSGDGPAAASAGPGGSGGASEPQAAPPPDRAGAGSGAAAGDADAPGDGAAGARPPAAQPAPPARRGGFSVWDDERIER